MNILGLATSNALSAALMVDGTLVGMFQEERFTKHKNQVASRRLAEDNFGKQL
jgi:predicted NodU family carbamoyl transferase